uniref:Putative yta7-like atpase n=1 Tax=Tetraselmis sp. GSL018 TaxID=582737 RepID=A0A061QYW7_9CHLO
MVILPLAYPHVFGAMGISPPRGILLHGAPGCGKTLLARALAGACQMQSETPVTLFSRKGADCLGEFAGEAERNLRLLFEEATLQAPSVVFLDELDALVPSRRGNEGSSDQMYASVVTTLLALMDGMADRVIGATNRPESIDTALRRPGRFDREVYIGLPGRAERLEILRVHTRRWERPVSQSLLETIASRTEGYGGADLAALCTSAVMEAARRCLPELPDLAGGPLCRLRGSAANAGDDPPREADANSESTDEQILAVRQRLHRKLHALTVLESDWAAALGNAPPPCSLRQGLAVMSADLCRPIPHHLAPALLPPLSAALSHIHASTSSPGGKLVAAAAAGHRCLLRRREGLAAGEEGFGRLEALLVGLGAVESGQGSDGGVGEPDRKEQHGKAAVGSVGPIALRGGSLPGISAGEATRTRPPFPPCRILMCSDGDRGQYAAAGGLLALAGSSSVVVGLPQMLDAGGGSPSEGVSLLLAEAVQRSQAAGEALFVYLPHLEAWAFDTFPTQMGGPVKGSTDGPPPTLSPPGKLFSWTCCAGLQEPEGLSGAGEGAQTTAVWSAVAAALAEHQARRQLVVLATCGRDICAVPEEIVRFFRRGLLVDAALSDGGVVVFPVSLSGACHAEVVRRTAARAASEVLAVLRGAVLRAPPRPEAEGAGMGPSEGGTAEGPPHAEPGESEGRDRDADLGRRRPRLEANQATLDMGRSLCSKVQDALALLGRQLCADRRARLARVAQSSGAVRLRTRDGPVGTSQPLASFSDLGRALAKGHIRDLAELRAAATGLSTSIRKDAEPTRTSAGSWAMSRSTVSSAASAALQDEIEDWAASLEGWLGLTSPDAVAAMAAAERLGRQRAPGDSGNGAGCVPGRRSGGEAGTGLAACGPADSELPHGSEAAACNPDGGESDAGAAAAAAAVRREMAEWTAALERCLSERLPALAELSLSGSAWTPRQAEQFIGRCCQSARRCSEPLAGALAAGGGARGPGSPLALPDAERLAREVLSLIGGARGGRDPP